MSAKYEIQVAEASSAVSAARGQFDDLYGHEGQIEAAGEALADALEEEKINTALNQAFSDFLKPWTVTFVEHGENILDAADTIISTFVSADGDMEDAANMHRRATIAQGIDALDDTPDYDPATAASSASPDNTSGGSGGNSDGRYDW